MKRFGIALLGALFVGGGLGALVVRDAGYVLVAYDGMSLESSLWFALLILVVAYSLLRLGAYLWARFLGSGPGLAAWNRERRARGSRKQTVQGLLLSAEQRWSEAHKLLVAGARDAMLPLVNYLHAADTAQALGAFEERDALLRQAREQTPGSKLAVTLTRARLQLDAKQAEQALAPLLEAQRESPRSLAILATLQRCYEMLGDWQAVLELAPDLRRQKALPEARLDELHRRAGAERLQQLGAEEKGQFDAVWALLPKSLQNDAELLCAAADALNRQGRLEEAEPLLREAISRGYEDVLVACYGRLAADPPAQLAHGEVWLKEHADDGVLLLALGRLAGYARQWEKSREYFEASLRIAAAPEVYAELARTCLMMNEVERAAEYLEKALSS